MNYRKEIDGLRAIAVLPVICFHSGLNFFSGGFVGVDIFFVISGYLITRLIVYEKNNDRFSLINFYERRARRILPALSVVLLFSTVSAYLMLDPWLLKQYSQSLVSVASFSSNFFFYLKTSYFAAASDEIPLIHTWSLAVEEQYYLGFPILVILLWRYGEKWLIRSFLAIALTSLVLAHYLSDKSLDANFYLIFSRAWELFFGSCIALIPLQRTNNKKLINELFSAIGLVMLVYSIVQFDESTPFPSIYTLVPVIGTSLVILFAEQKTIIGRFLTNKILVFIGLISYSLYLWHHSVFAFLRHLSIGEPAPLFFAIAIALSFVISFLSWKYVEQPFRNKKRFKTSTIAWLSLSSTMFFLSIGVAGHLNDGFPLRFSTSSYADSIKHSPKREQCHTCCKNYLPPAESCRYSGSQVSWAVFGDSHMVEPAYALANRLKQFDIGLLHLTFSGCPPSRLFELKKYYCTSWINESVDYLINQPSISHIFLGFRYTKYLFGDQLDSYPKLPNIDPTPKLAQPYQQYKSSHTREVYWESFERIVTELLLAGKTVYILYPIPELPISLPKAIKPLTIFGNTPLLDLERATTETYYYERNQFILSKLDQLPYGPNLHAVKPFNIICANGFCPAIKLNQALYFDDNHLSITGAKLVIESIDLKLKHEPNQ